jgi:hypothetical protein
MLDRNVNNNMKGADGQGRNPRHPVLNDVVRLTTPTALMIPHFIVMGLAAKWWNQQYTGTPDAGVEYNTAIWALIAFSTAIATGIFDYIAVFGHHPTDRFYQRQEHQYDGLLAVVFQHTKTLVFHAVSLALNTLAMTTGLISLGFAAKNLRRTPSTILNSRNKAFLGFMIIAGAASFLTWLIKLVVLRIYNDTPYVTPAGTAPASGYGAVPQGSNPNAQAYNSVYPQTGAGTQYAVVNQNAPVVP